MKHPIKVKGLRISDAIERSGKRERDSTPSAHKAKVEIREQVLREIGAANARVFDAYAGAGRMYEAVWNRAKYYVGCDKEWFRDERPCYVADNLRVMRAIDLSIFSIFDLDAWGGPWEQVCILIDRRELKPGERIGLVLTDGSNISIHYGSLGAALARLNNLRQRTAGLARYQGELSENAIARTAEMMGGVIVKRWHAVSNTATKIRYDGLVIERPPGRTRRPAP